MNQTAPKWNDYAAGDADRLLRYSVAPGLARRTYFDQFILPKVSGTPEQIESVWAKFNAKADAADSADERRANAVQRLKSKAPAEPMPFADFLESQLDEGSFTPEQYRDSPMVRGLVRSAYFEAIVLPRVGVGQNIGQIRAKFNKKANDLDRIAGRVTDDLMPDPATAADRSGLPSLTPTNLNSAREDDTLHQAIAKRAARTVQAEEPGLLERAASWLIDQPALSGAAGLTRQARRNAPVETQRRVQLQDIAREELAARLTQGGTKPEAVEVILNSPRGREIVRDTARKSLAEGAKLANQGDATWSRLVADMKHAADRMTIESMRKLSYAMLKRDMITREEAQALWKSGEEMISQIPESLDRGFWGNAVTDVAGMAPILTAGGLLAAIPGAGLVLPGLLFAAEAEGGFYHYAIEEAGLPENGLTKSMTLVAGGIYGALESLQLNTITTVGKRGLIPAIETAIKNSTLTMQKKLALRSGVRMTEATAEQMLQEGAQQMVDELHKQFADQKGIDWSKVFDEGLKAARESFGASVILTGGFGLPAHAMQSQQLRSMDASMKEAAAEVARSTAENKSAAEQKLAAWQRKADNLRSRLGLVDAPQTTEGGPLPAPTVEQAPQPEGFSIEGQPITPGTELEGPQGRVTVVEITPDPESTEQQVVLRPVGATDDAGDIVMPASEMLDYKPIQKKAAAPKQTKAEPPKAEPVDIGGKSYAPGDGLVDKKSKRWYDVQDAYSDGERGWVIAVDRKTKERVSIAANELGAYSLRKPKPKPTKDTRPVPAVIPVPAAGAVKQGRPTQPLMLPAGQSVTTPNFIGVEGTEVKPRDRVYRGETPYKVFSVARDERGTPIGMWIEDENRQFALVKPGELEGFTRSPKKPPRPFDPLNWTDKVPTEGPIVPDGGKSVLTDAPKPTDRFTREATKGRPFVGEEPIRLRDTLYRDGRPYRVFRLLDDQDGKVYAVEFEGIEKPVTRKELKQFTREKPIQQEEPPVAETQAAPEPAPVVAESPAPKPAKPRTRKPKAASKPAVTPPAAPEKAPEPEAAKPEPAKATPAAEAPKVEAAPAEATDTWTPADMGNTSLADPKPALFSKFNIDLKRFQNREDKEGFSEDTAESVYQQALAEGGLGFLKGDPIVWWTDPKTKKRFILEGHSRYEGARRYKEKSGKKDLPIPAIEFRGTEAQAITKARTSNFRRTDETPLAASKFVSELKQEGASKAEQERKAKEIGKRDHLTVLRLGQLARDGKAVTMLRATEKGAEAQRKQAANIAEWVGEARWRYTGLTDAHENEITDYLNDKYGDRVKNQADALAIISDAVERHKAAVQTLIDPIAWESPINLASTETETVGDREFKRLLGEAKGELRDAEARRDKLTANRAKAINDGRWEDGDEELYRQNFEKLTTARDEAWAAVRKLEESRPDFVQSIDELQIDLFATKAPPSKPKAPETPKAAPQKSKGHITFFTRPDGVQAELYVVDSGDIHVSPVDNVIEIGVGNRIGRQIFGPFSPVEDVKAMFRDTPEVFEAARPALEKLQAENITKAEQKSRERNAAARAAMPPPNLVLEARRALYNGTYQSAKSDLVALGRQIVADGHNNTLPKFTQELKRLLGEHFAKLKGKLKDLWEAVKDESGFVRLPNLRKMAGKDDQRGPVRKFARRVLTRDRGLGTPVANLKDRMEGEMRAVRTLLDFKAKKFRKAMKAVYPKGYSMVELEKVHAALTDPQPLFQYQHLPPALVPVVKEMRATIDRLTQSLIDSGAAAELVDTLRDHIGSYLTRSYRIFDDQKYLQEVLNAVSDINGQGSGRYGKDIGVKAVKAADYIRAAFTIPEGDDLTNMAWPDLLSLAAHRGLTVKGRTKAEVLKDLQGMADRVPSDTAIRAMLTDLLDKARDATSQTAFRTGRQQGQMDLSSMLRRQEIPEVLRDLMGEHKDPLVNFYRSGLRISQQVAKWKFMNAVVAQGLKDGTLYRERTTGPDPFSPGLRANFDAPLGKKDDPTTAPFAGIYGTQEFVDALRRGFESKDQPLWTIRMMMRTGAAVKIGKTALSIDTTIRNFMGNPYFALMQGHVRFWEMGKAMRTAGAAFGRSGTLEDVVVDLVRRGVIGDTVFASEIAAFMHDAAIKSDGFETFHANIIEAVLGGGKKALNVSMGTYQMMDDIWKVYGYLHEVRRYEAVGKKKGWTTDQIRNRAAEIVKATYPSYSQLPELVQWFRLDPFVAPFVSFSASVARGHYMTARIAAEELADADTRALGMIRIAGMTAAAVAYYGLKEIGQYLSGMDDDDDRAARKLLPPQDQDGNIIWLDDPMKSGNLHYINASYTVGGAYVLDAAMSVLRGAGGGSLEAGFTEAIRGLMDPWTSLDLVAQMLDELSSNATGTTGRKIYNPADLVTTEGLWNAAGDIATYIGGKAMPGIGRTLNSYKKALDGAIDLYGTEYTVGNATAKTLGWNAVTRDVNQATAGSLRFLKSMQGNTIDGLVSAIKDDPTDDDIRDSARRMEKTRQILWVKQYEVIQTAQRFGLSRGELRKVMDAAQFTKEAQQDLLSGRYRSWWTSGQFMEGTEKSILLGKAGKKGAAELSRRRKVLEDYLRVLKKEDFGVLPEGVKKR